MIPAKYIRHLLIIACSCLTWCSCRKFVQVAAPIDQVTTPAVFSNSTTATSAILGLYYEAMTTSEVFLNGGYSVYAGNSADELYSNTPNENTDPFLFNAIPSNSTNLHNWFWDMGYTLIYQSNACLKGLEQAPLSDSLIQQLSGEAKFMRALSYFYLINSFGDVPLVTSTDYKSNASLPRTPLTTVYQQIISDLHDAGRSLTPDITVYGTSRPNKWTATALLARVYLYQKNWPGADSAASVVIGSGNYSLVSNLNSVFLSGSPEAILQFIPFGNPYSSSEGASFLPHRAGLVPRYNITSSLLAAFEPGDLRKTDWLNTLTINGTLYTFPYKFKIVSSTPVVEYNMVLRYAEQYLIRAEAKAQQNDIADGKADLDMIRGRAGLPGTTASDMTSLLAAIMHERQVEFFAEWGHRWFDLKRTGTIDAVLGTEKTGWKTTDALYPVPLAEMLLNPFLTQNPGY